MEKQTEGSYTYLGPAKPDDPIWKEGWTVTMWPGSCQQSPEPSDNPMDEADESPSVQKPPSPRGTKK